jgi:hypothetical protein
VDLVTHQCQQVLVGDAFLLVSQRLQAHSMTGGKQRSAGGGSGQVSSGERCCYREGAATAASQDHLCQSMHAVCESSKGPAPASEVQYDGMRCLQGSMLSQIALASAAFWHPVSPVPLSHAHHMQQLP